MKNNKLDIFPPYKVMISKLFGWHQTNLLLFVWLILLLLFIKTLDLFAGKANWFIVIRYNSVTFVIIVKTKTGPQGGIYLIKLWDTIVDSSEKHKLRYKLEVDCFSKFRKDRWES